MANRTGLVLAGGRGRRMGGAKGGLRIGDSTLAGRAASTLEPLCRSVLVSLAPGARNPVPGCDPVFDPAPAGRGPLAGIAAGFAAAGDDDLLVLACDYPAVTTDLLRILIRGSVASADVVIPTGIDGREHPLVGLWARSAERAVAGALAVRRMAVRDVLRDLRVVRLAPADFPGLDLGRLLVNANRPGDLAPE